MNLKGLATGIQRERNWKLQSSSFQLAMQEWSFRLKTSKNVFSLIKSPSLQSSQATK